MEFNTVNSLQRISPKDGHITVNDIKNLDTDKNGSISQAEGAAANIEAKDLPEINKEYSAHKSDPTKVIFGKEELEAKKLQAFTEKNFSKIDKDNDGFLSKKELSNALKSNEFNAQEKQLISKLLNNVGNLEEYSNDEWFDENDGITRKDMKVYVKEKEKEASNLHRSDYSVKANEIHDFVKSNFRKTDTDKDGFLSKDELTKAIYNPAFKGDDAAMLAGLVKRVGTLEEFSNDEWFDENDGITMKDMEAFVEKAEKDPRSSDVLHTIQGYQAAGDKIKNASHDLYADKSTPLNSIRLNNMAQGDIGDCFFLSAVAGVVDRNPQAIKDMIKDNGNGTYTVKFPGADREVTVAAPTDGEIALYATTAGDGMWLTLLEKAYAELRNSTAESYNHGTPHKAIDGGDFQDAAIKLLTGHKADTDYLPLTSKDSMRSKLMAALRPDDGIKRIVTASTFMDGDRDKNMIPNHVFTILDYDPNTDKVKVRNPWGPGSDARGTRFSGDGNNDGIFELSIDELDEYFNLLAFEENKPIDNYDHLHERYWYKIR